MEGWFSLDATAGAGAALAALTALTALAVLTVSAVSPRAQAQAKARRAPRVRTALAVVAVPTAVVAGNVWVLVAAWLTASVVAAVQRPEGTRAACYGTLADAAAVAVLAAGAADRGTVTLPWHHGFGATAPDWVLPVFATAVAGRAVAVGTRDPALLVVGLVAVVRLGASVPVPADPSVAVAWAPLAVVLAWLGVPIAAVVALAAGALATAEPVATDAGVLLAAGAAVAVLASAFRDPAPAAVDWDRRSLARRASKGPTSGGVTEGGVALLASLPGLVVLGGLSAGEGVAGAALLLAAAATVALLAAGRAAVPSPRPAGSRSRRLRRAAVAGGPLLAAAALVGALLTPGVLVDLAGVEGSARPVVERAGETLGAVRGATAGALAFGAVAAAAVAAASRRRTRR